ncbi:MAG: hypothetical protein HYZ27_11830 [Deltaproteobacteria bacterium]|nr:hypothetical protein [Deltaproteobacteria bacterium]
MTPDLIHTLLLLALPASGKSEVRKYLASVPAEACRRDFHLGPTVQLDDFPYVPLMRRTDDVLRTLGKPPVFFRAADQPFADGRDWGTLIELVNEDHAALVARRAPGSKHAGEHMLMRLATCRERVGAAGPLAHVDAQTRGEVAAALEDEARALYDEQRRNIPDTLEGKTVVIEFARGGAEGAKMPLAPPYGYGYSLSRLSSAILERASILYVWVTPEESRRKNLARADRSDPGSILHHSVPADVMRQEYGCDDIEWLMQHSDRPGALRIEAHGKVFHPRIARFDNRVDLTSFVRKPKSEWAPAEVQALHHGLKSALLGLVS